MKTRIFIILLSLIFLAGALPARAEESRDAALRRAKEMAASRQYAEAESVYRSLVERNPKDAEARTALAYVLAWREKYEESIDEFQAVLAQTPDDRDALLGLASVYFWKGERKRSLETLEDLLASHPQDAEALALREKISRPDASESQARFKARLGYLFQDLSFTRYSYGTGILLSYEESKRYALRAGFQFLEKFGDSAPGGRAGGSYWFAPGTRASLDIEFAPGQVVVPRQAYAAELSQALAKPLIAALQYRFADYRDVNSHAVTPSLNWYFLPRLDVLAQYTAAISQFAGRNELTHSALGRLNWAPTDFLLLFAGYARANESFESGSTLNPVAGFSSNHVFGGWRWEFSRSIGLDASFDYENRDNGTDVKTFEAGLFYRW